VLKGRSTPHMPQTYGPVYLHIVFSTKHREALLTPELHTEFARYITPILKDCKARLRSPKVECRIMFTYLSISVVNHPSPPYCVRSKQNPRHGFGIRLGRNSVGKEGTV